MEAQHAAAAGGPLPAAPVKTTFLVQSNALLRKNLRLQRVNCKTNCCLVLTPLVFSVVLGVVSYVLNSILFAQPDFQCGCRCAAYTTPDGFQTFSITDPLYTDVVDGETVWKTPLIDSRNWTYYWDLGWLTCTGGRDKAFCGAAHSEARNRAFCPIKKPMRWTPLLQIPNPPYRPASGTLDAAVVDDLSANETWSADGDGADDQGFYGDALYARPAPFLFTSAPTARALARRLADALLFDDATAAALADVQAQLAAAQAAAGPGGGGQVAALSAPVVAFAANTSGPIGNLARIAEVLPLYPLRLALGTSAAQPRGQWQTDPAFEGKPLALLRRDCGVRNESTRNELNGVGQMLRTGSMPCVTMPGVQLDSAAAINAALFAGYGQGAPSELGAGTGHFAAIPFAVDFHSTDATLSGGGSATTLSATLWYNGTLVKRDGSPINTFFRISGALNRVANAYLDAALVAGVPGPRATMRYVRDMPTQGLSIRIDVGAFLGPLFYTWLSQMLLPVIVGGLVYEKEKNLRMMMRMQGLGDSAYMLVSYGYYFLLYFTFMLLIYFYGFILGRGTNSLSMWTRSAPGPVILFFILFVNVQLATAFFFQAVFSSAKTATVGSVLYLLISGLLGKFLFEGFLESPDFGASGVFFMQLLVPFSLYRGYYEMAAFGAVASYAPPGLGDASVGLSWPKLAAQPRGMGDTMAIFSCEWVLLGIAARYLDQVYASGSGIKRHPLFFLDCLLRREEDGAAAATPRDDACAGRIPRLRLSRSSWASSAPGAGDVAVDTDPPDVRACRAAALATPPHGAAILARGLAKTYPGIDGAPPKVACRDLSVAIPAGECFGLLGPNGAGKSTAINLLIGFLTPSRGEGFIAGCDLRRELDTVYSLLGVCPQHDLLWEQLSAREHLRFYGRLKRLSGAALEEACDEALRSVNLFNGGVGNRPCGTYSGGMKRRLSVAISLIGDPPVVFLDEPSTGLDPASRATLWEVIKKAKQSRAIVLTTHAMEEAEELCDRLGIFVDGALRCVGAPRELTGRYGGFLVLSLTTLPARVADAERFVCELSPGAVRTYALGGTLKFDLPLSEATIASVVGAVTERKEALGIMDWGVSNVTLEEVFIKLAREIGATTKEG